MVSRVELPDELVKELSEFQIKCEAKTRSAKWLFLFGKKRWIRGKSKWASCYEPARWFFAFPCCGSLLYICDEHHHPIKCLGMIFTCGTCNKHYDYGDLTWQRLI